MTDEQFHVMLKWFMSSDPWPLDEQSQETIGMMLDEESEKKGFDGWIDAFHEFKLS